MGNRFIGKGIGSFNSINISYLGKYFSFAIEPFYLNSQNKPIEIIGRNGIFSKLNDVPYNRSSYEPFGFRESMIFVHYTIFDLVSQILIYGGALVFIIL